ncbi:MAG: hypothetical protein OJF49_002040 [Ktedonobacterales bacterium]|nr:MAG: hypothetical protein OJF49_002040 [Ktedonobacterales bacterium]
MLKHRKARLVASFALLVGLMISAVGATAFARTNASTATSQVKVSATRAKSVQVLYQHTVDMSKVPAATASQLATPVRAMPLLTPAGSKAYQSWQHSNRSQNAPHNAGYTPITTASKSANLPSTFNKFNGQKDSAATCPYFGGCQPPDMAIAGSPAGLVMQSVNTSLAVYNLAGTVQSGWPKTAQAFFGVANPGACDTNGPFLSDPRLWWDAYDNRFVAAELQVEGAFGLNACPFSTLYWIAVSMSPNPSGSWSVFAINMAIGSDPTGAADYTQLGVSPDGIYVSANMFNQAGSAYDYAETIGCGPKTSPAGGIYQGFKPGQAAVKCQGYYNWTAGSVVLDTLNPTGTVGSDNSPRAEYFVGSFNSPDAAGHDCVTTACNGVVVLSMSNPAGAFPWGGAVIATAHNYLEPPGADQPSCTGGAGCVESLDLRVSATPVYHAGHIFAAHVTGITNGASQFVPGVQWWDLVPTLSAGYPAVLTGLSLAQDGLLNASSNFTALTFPVMMPTIDNDVILGYDYMGDVNFPSINFTDRRQGDPPSTMNGLGIIAVASTVSTNNGRWGDYEAMSYTASYQDTIWFSSQYANAAAGGDWITSIMRLSCGLTC